MGRLWDERDEWDVIVLTILTKTCFKKSSGGCSRGLRVCWGYEEQEWDVRGKLVEWGGCGVRGMSGI